MMFLSVFARSLNLIALIEKLREIIRRSLQMFSKPGCTFHSFCRRLNPRTAVNRRMIGVQRTFWLDKVRTKLISKIKIWLHFSEKQKQNKFHIHSGSTCKAIILHFTFLLRPVLVHSYIQSKVPQIFCFLIQGPLLTQLQLSIRRRQSCFHISKKQLRL